MPSRRALQAVLAAALLAAALPGCSGPGPRAEASSALSSSLSTSPPPTAAEAQQVLASLDPGAALRLPPAPFAEGEAAVQRLAGFLRAAARREAGPCGVPDLTNATETWLARGQHLAALDALASGCTAPAWPEAQALAREAGAAGDAEARFGPLRARAWAAEDAAKEALAAAAPKADTMAEAELFAFLVRQHRFDQATLALADDNMADYRDDPRPILALNAFLDVLYVERQADLTVRLVAAFDWDAASGCAPPPALAEALAAHAESVHRAVLEAAASRAPPEEAEWVDTLYGRARKVAGPDLEYAVGEGWTPPVAVVASEMGWDALYWELHGAARLPDRNETAALLALHRSEERTLWGEFRLGDLDAAVADEAWPWESQQVLATRALALPGFQSRFSVYSC